MNANGLDVFSPNYRAPRSYQMNLGIQQELHPGTVITIDYIRQVGEHSLIFAAGSEHIVLTHRAFDRRTFAAGAVRAALWAVAQPAGLYSMMDVLGMG